jgi:hypothetical protein
MKNYNLDKFLRAYWYIWKLGQTFDIFYGRFADLAGNWNIFLRFGILKEKSGNPDGSHAT